MKEIYSALIDRRKATQRAAASEAGQGNPPAVPSGAVLKEGAVPPMPPGAFVKKEQMAPPPMPPGAFVKEEQAAPPPMPPGAFVKEEGVGVSSRPCRRLR